LAAVLELYLRAVVGWSMSHRITRDLILMALWRRNPDSELLHHSDRGSHYASGDFQELLDTHSIVCPMSSAGSCYDCDGELLRLAQARAGE
jgi:putative transposase